MQRPLGVMVYILPVGICSIISLIKAVTKSEISSGEYFLTLGYWVNTAKKILYICPCITEKKSVLREKEKKKGEESGRNRYNEESVQNGMK